MYYIIHSEVYINSIIGKFDENHNAINHDNFGCTDQNLKSQTDTSTVVFNSESAQHIDQPQYMHSISPVKVSSSLQPERDPVHPSRHV